MALKQAISIVGALLMLMLGGWVLFLNKPMAPPVTFSLINGTTVDSNTLRGKTTLVSFWATTCPSCISEMPTLIQSYQKYHAQGFEIIAVAMDYDPPTQVKQFVQQHQLPFPVALDHNHALASSFDDVRLTPTAFLIDRQGRIVRRYLGAIPLNVLEQDIKAALPS